MEENNELINNPAVEYTDDNIRHLINPFLVLRQGTLQRFL